MGSKFPNANSSKDALVLVYKCGSEDNWVVIWGRNSARKLSDAVVEVVEVVAVVDAAESLVALNKT